MYYLGNVKFIVPNNRITVKSIIASFSSNHILFLVISVSNKWLLIHIYILLR